MGMASSLYKNLAHARYLVDGGLLLRSGRLLVICQTMSCFKRFFSTVYAGQSISIDWVEHAVATSGFFTLTISQMSS